MKLITRSLGCKVNAYETGAVAAKLYQAGFKRGGDKHFDVALINTCTVTHVASQKSRQHIRQLRKLNPNAIIVVMGCYANHHPKEVLKECAADIVVGVNERKKIPTLIKNYQAKHKKLEAVQSVDYLRHKVKYEELGIAPLFENTRAYVKISDGCNNFCSYCIIPTTRGRLRSRDPRDILCEIRELLKRGYKEIVLTGIDTSSYGQEFKHYRFADLLKDILTKFPKLYRLRISSTEISEIDHHFLTLLKQYPNIASHLHIPLQSGSDRVLKKMNRKYLTKDYLAKINAIRRIRPDIAITTDLIVGYPSEDERAFKETLKFIQKINFADMHVFPFSPREGTAAYLMKDLSPLVKKARVKKVMDIAKAMRANYIKHFLNKKLEVLFETNDSGLTSNYLCVYAHHAPNSVHKIKLTKTNTK
ncbi:MAG: tRNA (N(6)-L-threonylcarbamoyladenosine(37)-C(2))-methylthiotransferase MtaB [Bacilli bacterium]|nr:tRNA (N(6)-L-threonylcarbamoyladenosine(37)-C(2))-methylthiotransferase MtaB [Bacilli bacterium]